MNNQEYLKTLKSQLRMMDAKSREKIMGEITASIDDEPGANLHDRFGSVYNLAAQYMEDMPTRATLWQRLGNGMKWALIGLGVVFAILLLFIFGFLSPAIKNGDDFDYSNLNAPELEKLVWTELQTQPTKIEFKQANLVIYSGDYPNMSYSCADDWEGSASFDQSTKVLSVDRNKCFLRLPISIKDLSFVQTGVVLAEAKGDLKIDLDESQMRIATSSPMAIDNQTTKCEVYSKSPGDASPLLTLTGKRCLVRAFEFSKE